MIFSMLLHAGFHLGAEHGGVGLLVVVEVSADFRRDGEAGRHGETDAGHFREVRALAAEEGLHAAVAVGLAVTPGVDILGRLGSLGGHDFLGGRLLGRGLLRYGLFRGDFLGRSLFRGGGFLRRGFFRDGFLGGLLFSHGFCWDPGGWS
jgi:hypothetical protein